MNKAIVISLNRNYEKFEKNIGQLTLRILKTLNRNNILLEIYLLGNQKMRFLNKKFRGKAKPANVLSFKEPKGFPHPELARNRNFKFIGEIYLNLDQTKVKNKENLTINQLLIHGLLHLLGYNHKGKNDRIKMEKKERKFSTNYEFNTNTRKILS